MIAIPTYGTDTPLRPSTPSSRAPRCDKVTLERACRFTQAFGTKDRKWPRPPAKVGNRLRPINPVAPASARLLIWYAGDSSCTPRISVNVDRFDGSRRIICVRPHGRPRSGSSAPNGTTPGAQPRPRDGGPRIDSDERRPPSGRLTPNGPPVAVDNSTRVVASGGAMLGGLVRRGPATKSRGFLVIESS